MSKRWKVSITIVLVVLATSWSLLVWKRINTPEKLYKKTIKEINQEINRKQSSGLKLDYPISRLRIITEKYPKSKWADDAQYAIAEVLNLDPEEQIAEYRKFIEEFPNSRIEEWTFKNTIWTPTHINEVTPIVLAQFHISWIYQHRMQEYRKAIQEYQKVIEAYPNVTSSDGSIFRQVVLTYAQIAKCYKELRETEKAIKTYQSVLDRFPDAEVTKIIRIKIEELKSPS